MVVKPKSARHTIRTNDTASAGIKGRPIWNAAVVTAAPSSPGIWYLSGGSKKAVKTYRWLYILAVFIGPYMTVSAVWTIADIFNACMAIPNLIGLLLLSPVVIKLAKEYSAEHFPEKQKA